MSLITVCQSCLQPRSDLEATRSLKGRLQAMEANAETIHNTLRTMQAAHDPGFHDYLKWALDEFTGFRTELARSFTEVRFALVGVRAHLRERRNALIDDGSARAQMGLGSTTAIAERIAAAERNLGSEFLIVDDTEAVMDAIEGLRFHLDHLYRHWHLRSVDNRHQEDRISGSQSPARNS